jgi:hypothetical protein
MSRQEQKIKDGAGPHLEPGEDVLVAIVAAPRGYTRSTASGTPSLGAGQQRRAHDAAEDAGLKLEGPMALALTPRRLLTLRIGTPIGLGIGGSVKELLSAISLDEVDAIEVKRIALRQNIRLSVRGSEIELEANAGASAKELAEAFGRARQRA